jgi:hypothetical protein
VEARLRAFAAHADDHAPAVHWVLTLVEAMRAEWGCSLHDALWTESVSAALALWPAMMQRHGADPGMTWVDKCRQRAKTAKRQELEERFTILPPAPRKSLLASVTSRPIRPRLR